MLFNSLAFAAFFILVSTCFFLCPKRFRWILLLLASIFFYGSFIPAYLGVLFFLIIVDYTCGRAIDASEGSRRRIVLGISIFCNIGILFFFKYLVFVTTSVEQFFGLFSWHVHFAVPSFALPIGISFHVFQSLSYVIEVYRRNYKAERHLGIYALYVLFFPQLVAGPIERPDRLIPQFYSEQRFDIARILSGLRLMLWGYIKKSVIADRLAPLVDVVFLHPAAYSGPSIVIATVFFAFQIYGDFSGYTDIARGSARVLGFSLVENFRRPYLSASVTEFWRRWHISLSSWFRDYVYISLGGNRVTKFRRGLNIMVTFLASGLWHGADWKYVLWGGLHGGVLNVEAMRPYIVRSRLNHVMRVLSTFAIVCGIWIFFRANTFADSLHLIGHLPLGWITFFRSLNDSFFLHKYVFLDAPASAFGLAVCSIIALMIVEWSIEFRNLLGRYQRLPLFWRSASMTLLLLLFITLGVFQSREFIYFQF